MKRTELLIIVFSFMTALTVYGCASSGESTEEKDTPPPAPRQAPAQEPAAQSQTAVPAKTDTVNVVNVQTSPKPAYEPAPASIPPSIGNFAIQIGAYKMQESADRTAVLAKERLGQDVSIITDKTTGLFKVLVGNFASKDNARTFRDEILQKFPGEYKDAWVTEITQK